MQYLTPICLLLCSCEICFCLWRVAGALSRLAEVLAPSLNTLKPISEALLLRIAHPESFGGTAAEFAPTAPRPSSTLTPEQLDRLHTNELLRQARVEQAAKQYAQVGSTID